MEIKEMQKQAGEIIDKIDKTLSVKHDNETTLMHLAEEFGEIAREVASPRLRNRVTNIENLEEEIADIILLASRLANNYNIDIETAIVNKINKLKQRHNL